LQCPQLQKWQRFNIGVEENVRNIYGKVTTPGDFSVVFYVKHLYCFNTIKRKNRQSNTDMNYPLNELDPAGHAFVGL